MSIIEDYDRLNGLIVGYIDEIARLTDENARLTAENEQLKFDRNKYIERWNVQCLIAEELDSDNQRMRAALEYITKQGTGHYADKRLSEIARKASGER